MGELGRLWKWLSNHRNLAIVALVGTGAATVMGGAWALYVHFSKPTIPDVKQHVSGIVAGRDVIAGRDINVNNKNFQLEQFKNLLRERNKEILDKIDQSDPKQRAVIESELAAIKSQYDDLHKNYEEQKANIGKVYKALNDFREDFPPDHIDRAMKALAKGDTNAAEALFKQALEKSSVHNDNQVAEAAYQLGVLAESQIYFYKAQEYYHKALQIQPNNPKYINAVDSINHKLSRYSDSEKIREVIRETERRFEAEKKKINAKAAKEKQKIDELRRKNDLDGLIDRFNKPD